MTGMRRTSLPSDFVPALLYTRSLTNLSVGVELFQVHIGNHLRSLIGPEVWQVFVLFLMGCFSSLTQVILLRYLNLVDFQRCIHPWGIPLSLLARPHSPDQWTSGDLAKSCHRPSYCQFQTRAANLCTWCKSAAISQRAAVKCSFVSPMQVETQLAEMCSCMTDPFRLSFCI